MPLSYRLAPALAIAGMTLAWHAPAAPAQQPAPSARVEDGEGGPVLKLTATSANVATPGSPVTIQVMRWTAEAERAPLLAALAPQPPATAAAGAGDRGGGAQAGRTGAAGRGARGRGRGPAAPLTPIAAFTAALRRATTVGYIWTSDITGYSIKYAYRAPAADGGERIVLASDRRLGGHIAAWRPTGDAPLTDYEFTVIELRLDARGGGEAKASLTGRVVVDDQARTVALESYDALPAVLQNIRR